MTMLQSIAQRVEALPEVTQREVLDFIEFLASRTVPGRVRDEDRAWNRFSLDAAMRGMEDENTPYTEDDLKESF